MTLRIDLADYLGHPKLDPNKELVVTKGDHRVLLTQDGEELDSVPNPNDDEVLVYIPKSLGTHTHNFILKDQDELHLNFYGSIIDIDLDIEKALPEDVFRVEDENGKIIAEVPYSDMLRIMIESGQGGPHISVPFEVLRPWIV